MNQSFTGKDDGTVKIRYGRIVYDYIALLIVGGLLIELVSGLIIDTFGDLRSKSNEIEEDCSSVCFICDKSRDECEKKYGTNGFNYHIYRQHYLWDYLFFIAYLKEADNAKITTLSTSERNVLQCLSKNDPTWLPCYA